METAETAVKFTLEKPLHELTEDDIAQVTREDCRRYLKEKGMRRPSWNKSQAIQQVIMLKSLLETAPDSDAAWSRKKLRIYNSPSSNTAVGESVSRGTSGDAEKSVSAEETTACRRKDLERSDSSGGFLGRFAAASDESDRSRATGSANAPVRQMTIFYSGKVNVYDNMPADKAQTVLNVAASPLQFPEGQQVDGTIMLQPLPCISKAVVNSQAHQESIGFDLQNLQTAKTGEHYLGPGKENDLLQEEIPLEGPSTRKASVQRYRDKRKDRFKSKRALGMTSPTSSDTYLSHQIGNQMMRNNTGPMPQIVSPLPHARCSSVDNDSVKIACLSAGLSNQNL